MPGAPPQPTCSNERDDDGDGLADATDPNCANDPLGLSEAPGPCNDTRDNDADLLVDRLDPTCALSGGISESGGNDAACATARVRVKSREKTARTLRAKGYALLRKPSRSESSGARRSADSPRLAPRRGIAVPKISRA